MKKIALCLLLFAAAATGARAQTINVINNTPFNVGLYISYSTAPGSTCATHKTVIFMIPALNNFTYNIGMLPWAGPTPPPGGLFTAVAYASDLWSPAHNVNSSPCGNSPRYNDGAVGDPGSCPWLTLSDCFIADPSNPGFFPPNIPVSATFTPGVGAVVSIN